MKCPYCNEDMSKGTIYGDRYMLKWLPEDKDLFLGIWAVGGIKIGEPGYLFERATVEAYVCNACKKMIIELNDSAK